MQFFDVLRLSLQYGAKLDAIYKKRLNTEQIGVQTVKSLGIQAVILDHDGILGPNFSEAPDAEGEKLIRRMADALPSGNIFVFTNSRRTRAARAKTYKTRFPEVTFIEAPKKPDPEGLLQASRLSGVPVDKIAVVDDGMLTGILMAVSSGAIAIYSCRQNLKETPKALLIRMMTTKPQIVIARFCSLLRKLF